MRVWQILATGGAAGALSLLALPVETLAPDTGMPTPVLRLLTLLQPAILVALSIAVGSALAPKVALRAPLAEAVARGNGTRHVLLRQLGPALVASLFVAAILLGYGWLTASYFNALEGPAERLAALRAPLVTRLLYGGIAEELLTRWGLVTLFAWSLWRIRGRPANLPSSIYWSAIALAALLFAAGHLPLLFIAGTPPLWLIGAVLIGNAAPGLLFGYLFWRHGLEAAMMAHAGAHLIAWAGT